MAVAGVSIDYMRGKLREWRPHWNVDRFPPKQLAALYRKEQQRVVRELAGDSFSLILPKAKEKPGQLTLF